MKSVDYLIVGGGMTADSAIQGIRDKDASGSIAVVSADSFPPYDRPPLSKGLWKGDTESSVWRPDHPGVERYLGRRIVQADPESKTATDDQGQQFQFQKMLLATGVRPRHLEIDSDPILYYRSFGDYQQLRSMSETGEDFVVVGGGFIGSEVGAALALNGKKVHLVFPGQGIGDSQYPAGLSRFLNDYYQEKGIDIIPGGKLVGYKNGVASIQKSDGSNLELKTDGVVAGVGAEPNIDLATQMGLTVDNGIKVDGALQTSHQGIYAAGDVANFFDPVLGEWRRVEHEDNANSMGRAAGQSMAGAPTQYGHSPFFYSDLFDLGYEAVGILSSKLQTFEDWKEPFKEGVVYYLRSGKVVGVLLWNVWDQVDAAREMIKSQATVEPEQLKGRLPR